MAEQLISGVLEKQGINAKTIFTEKFTENFTDNFTDNGRKIIMLIKKITR